MIGQLVCDVDRRAAIIAGAVAGIAYAMTMEIDNRMTGQKIDDFLLLGRPFISDSRRARRFGAAVHLGNAAGLGVVYAALAHERFPGPAWLRGVIFGTIENTVLYPMAALDRFHPAVREGTLDRYWTVAAYLQSIPRHVAYGAVVGSLYERLRR